MVVAHSRVPLRSCLSPKKQKQWCHLLRGCRLARPACSEPESERARVFPATSSGQIRSSPPAWPPAPLGLAAPLRPQGGVIMTLPLQPRGWGWEGSFPKKGGVRPQTHWNSGLLASLPKLCVFSTLRPRTRSGEGGHRTAPRMALIASSGGRQILCFGFLTVTFPVWVSGASVRNPAAVPPAGRNIHPSADSGGHRWAEELRQHLGDCASGGLLHSR